MTPEKIYNGNVPDDGMLVAESPQWKVFYVPRGTATWRNYKLISIVPRTDKANYWLGVSIVEGRFSATRDYTRLKTFENELLEVWIKPIIMKHEEGLKKCSPLNTTPKN